MLACCTGNTSPEAVVDDLDALIRELRNVGAAVNISGRVIVLSVGGSRELLSLLDSVLGPNSLVDKFGVQIETAAILIRHFYSTPYKPIALSGNVLP